jgi:Spx/MgsR family transcriptional regulator
MPSNRSTRPAAPVTAQPAAHETALEGTRLFGIPNCDTVKRARAWLAERQVDADFHDFKKSGVPTDRLDAWIDAFGWETLLNRKGTTWRSLDDATRAAITDAAQARALMLERPSVIRRPVVEWADGEMTVGFEPDAWDQRHPVR